MSNDKEPEPDYKILYEELSKTLSQLDPAVQWWLSNYGKIIRVIRLDMKPFLGQLLTTRHSLEAIHIGILEETKDWQTNEIKSETKIVIARPSELKGMEIIENVEITQAPKDDKEEKTDS